MGCQGEDIEVAASETLQRTMVRWSYKRRRGSEIGRRIEIEIGIERETETGTETAIGIG